MSTSLFCATCGAALTDTATLCAACGTSVVSTPTRSAPVTRPLTNPTPVVASAPASTSPRVLPPGFLLQQHYQILRELGQGGFATVYKARDRSQRNKVVAIKQVHLETLNLQAMLDATDSYTREVNALSLLGNKYLPRIYAHFMDEHHWYIVMEYIAGQTLEEKLATARHGSLSVLQVLNIGITLCDALQHLHMQQPPLIFRDLKPANIILTRANRLYLIDFGTSRSYRPGWKDTGPLGTPGYAAPEQYGKRAHTTPQSDIYGLGATLQTLLTGKDPLEIRQHGIPAERAGQIPQTLLDELAHMQARNATQRPRNMAEVKQTLQAIKAQLPSQKARAAGAFAKTLLLNGASLFAYIALLLLVVINFAASLSMSWVVLWGISLFLMGIFTLPTTIFKLREARLENQGSLSREEKISILWKQLSTSWFIALAISLLIYYLFYILHLFATDPYDDYPENNLILFIVIVGSGSITCIGWMIRWLMHVRADRQRTNQAKATPQQSCPPQQEILVQQHIHNQP